MGAESKKVFISYRRSESKFQAIAIFQYLAYREYDVFMDFESLGSGYFEQVILAEIAARPHFIVLLAPKSLDRVVEGHDWLRREIQEAIRLQRNIVPLFFDGFSFNQVEHLLTGKLARLSKFNGLPIPDGYFSEGMSKLENKFLTQSSSGVISPAPVENQPVVQRTVQDILGVSQDELGRYPTTPRRAEAPQVRPAELPRKDFEPELVRIPAGPFLMGSTDEQIQQAIQAGLKKEWAERERPQHKVDLPDFFIGKRPVTNDQYAAFVRAAGHAPPKDWDSGEPPFGKDDHPVVYVSWDDAQAYCRWLAEGAGKAYRLPSEAEWEKAARGEDGRIYPWGNAFDKEKCNIWESGVHETTPVGRYSPQGDSPYGCADMSGNVFEWTNSLLKRYPYDLADGREDLEVKSERVLRGGSWNGNLVDARCASRYWLYPFFGNLNIGFRVVVSPSGSGL